MDVAYDMADALRERYDAEHRVAITVADDLMAFRKLMRHVVGCPLDGHALAWWSSEFDKALTRASSMTDAAHMAHVFFSELVDLERAATYASVDLSSPSVDLSSPVPASAVPDTGEDWSTLDRAGVRS
jgi:hypothetical protein